MNCGPSDCLGLGLDTIHCIDSPYDQFITKLCRVIPIPKTTQNTSEADKKLTKRAAKGLTWPGFKPPNPLAKKTQSSRQHGSGLQPTLKARC